MTIIPETLMEHEDERSQRGKIHRYDVLATTYHRSYDVHPLWAQIQVSTSHLQDIGVIMFLNYTHTLHYTLAILMVTCLEILNHRRKLRRACELD